MSCCNLVPFPDSTPCGHARVNHQTLIGQVLDLRTTRNGFVFKFGVHGQVVEISRSMKPDGLVDGVWVELDPRLNTVALCEDPGLPVVEQNIKKSPRH